MLVYCRKCCCPIAVETMETESVSPAMLFRDGRVNQGEVVTACPQCKEPLPGAVTSSQDQLMDLCRTE